MISRLLKDQILTSNKSVLVLGPRQVGKSTLLESMRPDMVINLASEQEFIKFSTNPGELESRLGESPAKTVFIDEVQRLPSLLNTIQVLIDRKQGPRFFLSGSSARKLRRGSANLLPGRIFDYRLGPLSCVEFNYKMDGLKALELGTLPEPYLQKRSHAEKLLRSYTATYLREEIVAESLTRQIEGFSRFLQTAAENAGRFLDFSKISGKAKVNRSAARRYFDLLVDTLVCDRVEAYASDQFDLVKHPKFYFFDVGVVNGVLENFKASADRKGLLFEHLFFNQLKNTGYCLDEPIKIFHFRTRNGLEVDFVVEIAGRTILIEVKSDEPTSAEITPILKASEQLPRGTECYVACLKAERRRVKGVRILPWQEVIREVFAST